MCGIVGILNLSNQHPVQEASLRQMLGMIRHRGPEEFGMYVNSDVGLGNARLSIIDLAGGQQPLTNEEETLWMVLNGEIYNYIELRAELEVRGHHFATNTDVEVVIHLYEDHGPACLDYLNGPFALAIWDSQRRVLFLARDRVGIRPLFYAERDGVLFFGSEIKALLADKRVSAHVDPISLDQVFTFWCYLPSRTIFRDIFEVPPGHYAIAQDGHFQINRYWGLSFPTAPVATTRSVDEAAEELLALLTDATRLRLRADVPVGAYLSGGLDSSTITALIRQHTGTHLETFSIAFSDPAFDESAHQQRMAQFLGTEHHVVYCDQADIGRVFPDVIWHAEMPMLRTAPAPLFLLSALVHRHNLKVVLTGEGSDEFLGGYNIYKEAKVRRFWAKNPESPMRPLLLQRLYPYVSGLSGSNAYLSAFFKERLSDVDAPDYSHLIRWRNSARLKRFFSHDVKATLTETDGRAIESVPLDDAFLEWDPLARAQYLEITIFLSQYLLSAQGDRVAMAHSVEGRMPFLDHRVMEFCNQLPPGFKLRGLQEKYLLKHAVAQGAHDQGPLLPEETWRRAKRPYRAPIYRSFLGEHTLEYVRDLLSPGDIEKRGLFDPQATTRLMSKIERGTPVGESDDMALVGILSTQLVHRLFVDDFELRPPVSDGDKVKVSRGPKIQTSA
jgi:asparagine synthase (glutamine-hydrolysing)